MRPEYAQGDPTLRLLSRLPPAVPDAARGERTRARCHAALVRQTPRPVRPPHVARRVIEHVVK